MKDLWIFAGPPQEFSEILSSSSPDLVRTLSPSSSSDVLHRRSGSVPAHTIAPRTFAAHARSTTESAAQPLARSHTLSPQNSRALLRKKSSRGSQEPTPPSSSHGNSSLGRMSMDDSRLSGSGKKSEMPEDMTGIGRLRTLATRSANDLLKEVRVSQLSPTDSILARPHRSSVDGEGPTPGRVKTGDLFYETGPVVQHQRDTKWQSTDATPSPESGAPSKQHTPRDLSASPSDVSQSVHEPRVISEHSSTSRIMNSNVFRDSAFSSATGHSYEIPIKWTGPDEDKWRERVTALPGLSATPSPEEQGDFHFTNNGDKNHRTIQRQSTTFNVPGGWQPSPIDEKAEDQGGLAPSKPSRGGDGRKTSDPPEMKDVDAARIVLPVSSNSPAASRRSQAALYGMTASQIQTPPSNTRPAQHRQHSDASPSPTSPSSPSSPMSGTGGWVLVSFADSSSRPTSGSIGESASQTDIRSSSRQRATFERKHANHLAEQKSSLHPVAKVCLKKKSRNHL